MRPEEEGQEGQSNVMIAKSHLADEYDWYAKVTWQERNVSVILVSGTIVRLPCQCNC